MKDNQTENLRQKLYETRFALLAAKMQNQKGNNQATVDSIQQQLHQTRAELSKQIAKEYQNNQSTQTSEQSSSRRK